MNRTEIFTLASDLHDPCGIIDVEMDSGDGAPKELCLEQHLIEPDLIAPWGEPE